jgi:hypothetical protein
VADSPRDIRLVRADVELVIRDPTDRERDNRVGSCAVFLQGLHRDYLKWCLSTRLKVVQVVGVGEVPIELMRRLPWLYDHLGKAWGNEEHRESDERPGGCEH